MVVIGDGLPLICVNIKVTNAIQAMPTASGAAPGICSTSARPPAAMPVASRTLMSTVPPLRYSFANSMPPTRSIGPVDLATAAP